MISYLQLRGEKTGYYKWVTQIPSMPPQKIKNVKPTLRSSARWVTQYNGH